MTASILLPFQITALNFTTLMMVFNVLCGQIGAVKENIAEDNQWSEGLVSAVCDSRCPFVFLLCIRSFETYILCFLNYCACWLMVVTWPRIYADRHSITGA